jgi:hypothetical protein
MNGIWNKVAEFGIGCGLVAAAWAIVAVIIGFPIKWLWNWIMPNLFNLPEISVWMALGIALLIGILFGGVINVKTNK